MRTALWLALSLSSVSLSANEPHVLMTAETPTPGPNARDVSPLSAVRVQFSVPMESATVTANSFQMFDAKKQAVRAEVNCDLTGGVATLTPVQQLSENSAYTVKLKSSIRARSGQALTAIEWTFRTGVQKLDGPQFRFRATELEPRGQITCVRLGVDGRLYAADVHGEIRAYTLGNDGRPIRNEVVARLKGQQIIGICFDPYPPAGSDLLWVSHARFQGGPWSGVITKINLTSGTREDVIVGLPTPLRLEHQPNQLAFGPDGRLYQPVGGVASLGGNPHWGAKESALSAAMIVADVRSPDFNNGRLPCDVTAAPPVNYDPTRSGAPVQVYATGLRNAVGICWHSNGHLYTATNGNSIAQGVFTPATDGVPAINAMPHESLCRIVEGKYYGHPNPSRGEYVLMGGNPTAKSDPWEVPAYPVGVLPDSKFDPRLLYDLRPGGGNSANGLCEYRGPGPLKGRMLAAYFSGGRCIQTFAFDKEGRVVDERPLVDENGRVLRFRQPLDLCAEPATGRIYLAVFGNWPGNQVGNGVESTGGGLWLLEPFTP